MYWERAGKERNNASSHTEAYARSHSGCYMKSSSFSSPEQLRGTRTRQTKKDGKQNKKIWIWILVWGKRGRVWKDLERGVGGGQDVRFDVSPAPVVLSVRTLKEGSPTRWAQKPLSASQKLLTLISVRALQLWHGVILALTWIDWCQRPPVLPKWALISFNVALSKRCFQTGDIAATQIHQNGLGLQKEGLSRLWPVHTDQVFCQNI